MILSMTGYGKSVLQLSNKKISIEIKSLNSKNLDSYVRTPSVYRGKELHIRKLLASKLERGKIDFSLLVQKDEQITLLMEQNWALEKQTDLTKPRWYENKWLYFAYGSAAIIIPTYLGIKIVEVAN